MFKDRVDAGSRLAEELVRRGYSGEDVVVLALPRGGVVVGYEVAKALGAELEVLVSRKLGSPGNPELGIGAIAEDGSLYLNQDLINKLGVSSDYLSKEIEKQLSELRRRVKLYRGDRPIPSLEGKIAILVDDGLATGATMFASIEMVKKMNPSKLVVAVPVAPEETVAEVEKLVDEVVCLATPFPFFAIGQFYEDFSQTSDEEVLALLSAARRPRS